MYIWALCCCGEKLARSLSGRILKDVPVLYDVLENKGQNKRHLSDNIVSEEEKKFHEFAVKSILFKGRTDWYFCYLKSERIAHVLAVLADNVSGTSAENVREVAIAAAELPRTVAHFAAGEAGIEMLLADIFSLLSAVRLAGASGGIAAENARILLSEYENLAQKLVASAHPSPFASSEDFSVPSVGPSAPTGFGIHQRLSSGPQHPAQKSVKDIDKGHSKGQQKMSSSGQHERIGQILEFVHKNKGVSIKDIAAVVRNCSEKTIQRELGVLIRQGLVKKVGERRWSLYMPA